MNVLTLTRALVAPDGTVEMVVHLGFIDGVPGYTHAFQLSVAKVAGHASPITIASITPNPLELVASASFPSGAGSGDATVVVTVPADVDASEGYEDSVYELQVTVVAVPAALYPFDDVLVLGTTASEHGASVDPSLRSLNGDLCIVPNGEAPIAHGAPLAEPDTAAYIGYFGGHFLDAHGSPTVASFAGRAIKETINDPTGDACWDDAVTSVPLPAMRNPAIDYLCLNGANAHITPGHWVVDRSDGSWGTCADTNSMDAIGRRRECAAAYIDPIAGYTNPPAQHTDPDCEAGSGVTQSMRIACRTAPYLWIHTYTSTPFVHEHRFFNDGGFDLRVRRARHRRGPAGLAGRADLFGRTRRHPFTEAAVLSALLSSLPTFAAPPGSLEVHTLGGGLAETGVILTARHGVSVHFEGVPRTLEGISLGTTVDAAGVAHPQMIYPDLRFTYADTATPKQAAQAAVDAWNKLAVDAHYKVVDLGGILNLVPTEARTADGRYVPFTPLMDTVIHLDRVTDAPTALYQQILAKVVAATGVPIVDGNAGFLLGNKIPDDLDEAWFRNQWDVTMPRADGTARQLLDDVVALAGYQTNWHLIWIAGANAGRGGWGVVFTVATVDEEWTFNGTPMFHP